MSDSVRRCFKAGYGSSFRLWPETPSHYQRPHIGESLCVVRTPEALMASGGPLLIGLYQYAMRKLIM